MLNAWQHEARRGLEQHRALKREGVSASARHQFLFRSAFIKIAELQILECNLKISKNKSCRGAIELQLSQRASYVLINVFMAKTH
jgi:hypothetical protein